MPNTTNGQVVLKIGDRDWPALSQLIRDRFSQSDLNQEGSLDAIRRRFIGCTMAQEELREAGLSHLATDDHGNQAWGYGARTNSWHADRVEIIVYLNELARVCSIRAREHRGPLCEPDGSPVLEHVSGWYGSDMLSDYLSRAIVKRLKDATKDRLPEDPASSCQDLVGDLKAIPRELGDDVHPISYIGWIVEWLTCQTGDVIAAGPWCHLAVANRDRMCSPLLQSAMNAASQLHWLPELQSLIINLAGKEHLYPECISDMGNALTDFLEEPILGLACFRLAASLDPELEPPRANAWCAGMKALRDCLRDGKVELGVQVFNLAQRLGNPDGPPRAWFWEWGGACCELTGSLKEAAAAYKAARGMESDSYDASAGLDRIEKLERGEDPGVGSFICHHSKFYQIANNGRLWSSWPETGE